MMPHKLEGVTERLQKAVLDSGKSSAQIIAETGISKSTYYKHMDGNPMNELHIARYCNALNVSADWLLGLKKEAKT